MYYFFTLLFLLISSRANFLSYIEVIVYLIGVMYFIAGVMLNRFRESDFRLFAKFTIIYFAFVTFRYVFLNNYGILFYLYDVTFYLKRIIFVFVFCAVVKEQVIVYTVKVTTHLALISLFFYPLQLVAGNLVFSIGKLIPLPPRAGNLDYTNFFVFTYDKGQPMRNAGFVWEPGAFGCFLVIALLLHFTLNKFKFNRDSLILVLAIITTLSTTAYFGALVVFLLYYRFHGGKLASFLFLAVPIIAVIAVEVPFLFDKIGKTYEGDQKNLESMDGLNEYFDKVGGIGQIPLNRFASATMIYDLFTYKLIWGISNGYPGVNRAMRNVNISNGDADAIARFGIIGYCFFLYKYGLLFKRLLYKNEFVFYSILVFFVLSFGECMPIFHSSVAFLFLYHYIDPDTFSTNETDEEEEDEEETEHGGVILNGSN